MKKHLLIGTTVVAMILSLGLLFFSVYAAVSQSFSINNRIHFTGSQNVKFVLRGQITGTTDDSNPALTFKNPTTNEDFWLYDKDDDNHNSTSASWEIPDLTIKSEGLSLEQVHLTYTFTIQNQGEAAIIASIDGPGDLASGLIKNTYVQTSASAEVAGTSVQIPIASTATIKIKLTLESLDGFSGQEYIAFSILINEVV